MDAAILFPMADAAGVCRGPDVGSRPRPVGAAAGVGQIVIQGIGELRQLIKADKVIGLALVVVLVLLMLDAAKDDDRAGGKVPDVLAVVVLRPGECVGIQPQGPPNQVFQLRIRPPDDQAPVIRDMDLPRGLHDQRVGLFPPHLPPPS